MNNRKICFVTTVSLTIQAFILDLAEDLFKEKGYDITFICNADDDFAKKLPYYFHYIPVNMNRGVDLRAIKTIIQLRDIFKKSNFDYIQYSTPNASFYSAVALVGIHTPIKMYAQWGIRYVGSRGIARVILKRFEKITCSLSSDIRAVSIKNMNFAVQEKLYKRDKVKVIGNGGTIGVDMSEFNIEKKEDLRTLTRKNYGIKENCFVFGFIGRLTKDKGANELLAAYKILHDKGHVSKLILVGSVESTNGLDSDLLEWAKHCDDVIIAGVFPRKELPGFYAAFDCYVHPTYREGFGMVLQEAGAMGNAIITTDVPGASEVMENNVSCELVPAKDILKLSEAMEGMINNAKWARQLGQAAYERTKNLYERSIMIKNLEEDLENLLGE